MPVKTYMRQGWDSSAWPLCPGSGREPARVVQPKRRVSKSKVRMPRGICPVCKRRMAVVGDVMVNHAPYRTKNQAP